MLSAILEFFSRSHYITTVSSFVKISVEIKFCKNFYRHTNGYGVYTVLLHYHLQDTCFLQTNFIWILRSELDLETFPKILCFSVFLRKISLTEIFIRKLETGNAQFPFQTKAHSTEGSLSINVLSITENYMRVPRDFVLGKVC